MAKKITPLASDFATRKKRHLVLEKMANILESLDLPQIKPKVNRHLNHEKFIQHLSISVRPGNSQLQRSTDLKAIVIETISQSIIPYEVQIQQKDLLIRINPTVIAQVNVDKFLAPEISAKAVVLEKIPALELENSQDLNPERINEVTDISSPPSSEVLHVESTTSLPQNGTVKVVSNKINQQQENEIDFRKSLLNCLREFGFQSPKQYISVLATKKGATVHCTLEGVLLVKEKLLIRYPGKVLLKDGEKAINVINEQSYHTQIGLESKSGSPTENGTNNNMETPPIQTSQFIQQTQIQTIQNKESMDQSKQSEILLQGKGFLKSLGISWLTTSYAKKAGTVVINIKDDKGKMGKKINNLKKEGVEAKGKAVHFSENFTFKVGSSSSNNPGNKNSGSLKKTKKIVENEDLESLFNKVRLLFKSGPDFSVAVKNFKTKYPGMTLWLQKEELSKKIKIEDLLKELFN